MNRVYSKPMGFSQIKTIVTCFIVFLLVGSAYSLQAQNASQNQSKPFPEASAKEGTYQLIFNSRRQDLDLKLSPQELIVIEKLRKDNEVVYARASYSDDLRVKILPRNVIGRGDFKPAPLKYFKDENNYEEWANIRYVEFE